MNFVVFGRVGARASFAIIKENLIGVLRTAPHEHSSPTGSVQSSAGSPVPPVRVANHPLTRKLQIVWSAYVVYLLSLCSTVYMNISLQIQQPGIPGFSGIESQVFLGSYQRWDEGRIPPDLRKTWDESKVWPLITHRRQFPQLVQHRKLLQFLPPNP